MNTRVAISLLLVSLGFILAFLPAANKPTLFVKPDKIVMEALNERNIFSADQVAKFVVTEDSSVQLIDLRPSVDYKKFSIPGAVNIPYEELIKNPDMMETALNRGYSHNIFYSNGDIESGYAFVLAKGLGFNQVFVMKGGLNGWFNDVMNSRFDGERISARENALFENRSRAKKLFVEINSLPDSLKQNFMKSRQSEAKKLDGGCE